MQSFSPTCHGPHPSQLRLDTLALTDGCAADRRCRFRLYVVFLFRQTLKNDNPKCYYNARGEELLRKSGLTYTIIRVEGFNNLPGGIQAIEIKQVRNCLLYTSDAADE